MGILRQKTAHGLIIMELLTDIGIRLSRDGQILFACRAVRMFSFGAITVVLLLYLSELGFSDKMIGVALTGR